MQLELDNECAQKLIRYLILTKQEPETLWRLLARLRKSSDMPLSKKECISISEILLARVPFKRRMISIVKPSTNSESYIRASHSSIQKVSFFIQLEVSK